MWCGVYGKGGWMESLLNAVANARKGYIFRHPSSSISSNEGYVLDTHWSSSVAARVGTEKKMERNPLIDLIVGQVKRCEETQR